MARYGFRYLALLSAHGGPRHDTALELACRAVMKKHRGVTMFTPTGDIILYVLLGYITADLKTRLHGLVDPGIIETLLPSDIHAGALETSLGLLYMPDLIKRDYQKLKDNILGVVRQAYQPLRPVLFQFLRGVLGEDAGPPR